MKQVVERRLDFLKLEGLGLSLVEIVKQLSEKYHKTERSIYYDAETRKTWQPLFTQLFDLDKARLIVVNRYERIYREAAFMLIQGNVEAKPAALKVMLDATRSMVSLLGLESAQASQDRTKMIAEYGELMKRLEEVMTYQKS
jgi:hypothetical protein